MASKKQPTAKLIVDNTPATNVAEVLAEVDQQLADNAVVQPAIVAKVNKAEIGRKIFEEELAKGSERKVYIQRLMAEASLTQKGAATYLQNMRDKAGLVHHRPTTAPVVATPANNATV